MVPDTTAVNMDQPTAEFRFNEAPGFGSRLRAAREAKGLALETCAHALRLPTRVLKQLESSEFAGIDYQVYLGGYLRKYGRYLELDDADIEAALAQFKPAQPPLIASGGVSHSRYLLDRYATAATYVVLTLVIAVPIVWLGMRGTLTHDMGHLSPLDASPVAQQDAPMPPATAGQLEKSGSSTAVQPLALAPALPAAASSVGPSHASEQPLLASMVPVPNLEADANTTGAGSSANPAIVGSGSHSMTLNVPDGSWVEVIGKDGSRLEYGLLPAGTTKTYRSDQPFEVRIGNAAGAQVKLDGQPVTLDPYRHSNVAHFRVDIQDGKAAPAGA